MLRSALSENRFTIVAWLGLALLFASRAWPACATDRPDFFDQSRKPSIRFDKGSLTWTFGNDAIERTVRFDKKTGGLRTLALRNRKQNRQIVPTMNSEGEMSFIAPLKEPPQPLIGWWQTTTAPPADWASPNFRDRDWKLAALPIRTSQTDPIWLRCRIPPNRMFPNHAYALVLAHALSGDAEIYLDGVPVSRIRANQSQFQIDLLPTHRVIGIKLVNGLLDGNIGIAEVGTSPPPLDLSANWRYVMHSVNANVDGSKVLTISLSGVKQHDGFDVDVCYQIYPGEYPILTKWFAFVSHRQTRFLLEQATFERWPAPPDNIPEAEQRERLLLKTLSPLNPGGYESDKRNGETSVRPYVLIKPETRTMTPKSLMGYYVGTQATGAFLLQLHAAQYLVSGDPERVPTVYHTRSYGNKISAALCAQLIPIAENIGAKVFVLGDGWQTNIPPDSGTYGDWVTDRTRFPMGLAPISLLAREHNLRFGLWTAPTWVNPRSQAATQYAQWLVKPIFAAPAVYPTQEMCFTSGWEDSFSKSWQVFCRELSITYLDVQYPYGENDHCSDPTHDHPVMHSESAWWEHWNLFKEKMRQVAKPFVLASIPLPWDTTEFTDTFGDQIYPARMGADAVRAWLLGTSRPAFALTGEVSLRPPDVRPDRNVLEYDLTSAAAYVCNMEITGDLLATTPEERALIRKWVKWNEENRPWLAYAQPILAPTIKGGGVDGLLHLRNALKGRYGYLCLWNSAEESKSASLAIRPADYFVKMNPANVEMVSVKTGQPVKFTAKNEELSLTDFTMSPRSWEILEIRQKK